MLLLMLANARVVKVKAGYTVICCPICRDLRSAMVRETQHRGAMKVFGGRDVYTLQTDLRCMQCKSEFGTMPGSVNVRRKPVADPWSVLEELPPDQSSPLLERIELEGRIREGRITPEERAQLIAEPIVVLQPEYQHGRGTRMHTFAGVMVLAPLGALAVVSFFVGMFGFFDHLTTPKPSGHALLYGIGGAVTLVASIVASVLMGRIEKRAVARRSYLPRIVRAMRPLRPSAQEVRQVMAALEAKNLTLATRIGADEIVRQLEMPETVGRAA